MRKRRARGETTTQQLLRWEKEDVCAGLTNEQERQLLEAIAELLIGAVRDRKAAPNNEVADE